MRPRDIIDLPLSFLMRSGPDRLRGHVRAIRVVGVINTAVPVVLLAYATIYLTAGFAARRST